MFENAGLSPANIHMRLDRFRFEGDTYAYVELADELQAKRAVEVLNGNEFLGSKVYFRALKPDYTWDLLPSQHRRFVVNNEAGIRDAIQPYLDGRRVRLSVKSPAWGKKGNVTQRRHTDLEVLERTFSKFDIEAISRVAPQHGQITLNPKYFCHIDFTTKKGADEAIHAFHNKEIEGVLVWVKNAEIDATKAYQIGTANKAILTELQEKGQAPTEIDENLVSKFTKRDPMNFDRGRNSTDDSRQYMPRAESAV
ncbi:hypothetical protein N0V90_008280 [Kalmusia sp. IMI 367209]|nr:hypothetical protein N0V90_008280 [Kalmusia sp. IMI 367209]